VQSYEEKWRTSGSSAEVFKISHFLLCPCRSVLCGSWKLYSRLLIRLPPSHLSRLVFPLVFPKDGVTIAVGLILNNFWRGITACVWQTTKPSWRKGKRVTAVCIWRPLGKKSKLSRKPHPRTKYHVDRQTGCEFMAIFVYPRWPSAGILDFWISKVAPLDRPTPKKPPLNETSCLYLEYSWRYASLSIWKRALLLLGNRAKSCKFQFVKPGGEFHTKDTVIERENSHFWRIFTFELRISVVCVIFSVDTIVLTL